MRTARRVAVGIAWWCLAFGQPGIAVAAPTPIDPSTTVAETTPTTAAPTTSTPIPTTPTTTAATSTTAPTTAPTTVVTIPRTTSPKATTPTTRTSNAAGSATTAPSTTTPDPASSSPATPAPDAFDFVSQSTVVGADGTFTVVLHPLGDLPADDAVIRVTSHDPVTSRQGVRSAVGGSPGNLIDSLDLLAAVIPRTADGDFSLTVATETDDIDGGKLQLRGSGVFPLTFEMVSGDVHSAALTTFIERTDAQPGAPVQVGLTVSVDAPPTLRTDGSMPITDSTREQLTRLAALLESAPFDVSVALRPQVIEALGQSSNPDDATLLTRLATALATRHELLAEPYLDVSPSWAVAADQTALFTEQLRHGEDTLRASLNGVQSDRSTWFASAAIDGPGLDLLRNLGFSQLVIDSALVPVEATVEAQGIDGELRTVKVTDASRMPAVISDPFLQKVLQARPKNPALLAHVLMADLVGLQLEASTGSTGSSTAGSGIAGRRAVMFTITDLTTVSPVLLSAVLNAVATSPRLAPNSATRLVNAINRGSLSGARDIQLPAPNTGNAVQLSFTIGRIEAGLSSTSSILPKQDPRPTRWARMLEVLPSASLTEQRRGEFIAQLDGEMGDIRSSVALGEGTGTISLGGRHSRIPLVITNSSPTPLEVLVRFSSPKLRFPDGDRPVTIPAANADLPGRLELSVPVVVQSSGRFRVEVQILTADGTQELVGSTAINARATILTGLAQVVTFAFIMILASWWVQHARRSRRRRSEQATESMGHHPSTAQ